MLAKLTAGRNYVIFLSVIILISSALQNLVCEEQPAAKIDTYLKFEKSEATVGEVIAARIFAEGPKGCVFQFPDLQSSLAPLFVTNIQVGQEKIEGDKVRKEVTFDAAAYETGKLETPELELLYELKGVKSAVKIKPVALTIQSVLKSKEEKLADIKGPARIPPDYMPVVVAAVIAAVLIVAAIAVFHLVRKFKKRRKVIPLEDIFATTPPHEWAYAELDRLMGKKFLEKGLFKDFYVSLSEILKKYMEGRYRIDTMERTTAEVMDAMSLAKIERKIRGRAELILKKCDMVKFARHIPSIEQSREVIQEVYDFIDLTKPFTAKIEAQNIAAGGERK